MSRYLNPHLTVGQAGPVLEQEFLQRFGQEEYERLYRTLDLQVQEKTQAQEDQIIGLLTLIGRTTDQTNLFLALVWLSKKEMDAPQEQAMLRELREKTIGELLQQARQAVGRPQEEEDEQEEP